MSYPVGNPASKHDLIFQRFKPPPASLLDDFGISNAAALFHKVLLEKPPDAKLLASVYSYKDGPNPPLSRSLHIVGLISETHAVMRKLIGEEQVGDEPHHAFHRCSLAVRRGDGRHAKQLDQRHQQNSFSFAHFFRRLRQERAAAVLGQDGQGRICILKPAPSPNPPQGDHHINDFHVLCFVGHTDEIKQALLASAQSATPPVIPRSPPPPPGGFDENGPVWNPRGDDHTSENSDVDIDDEPVFKPDDYDEYKSGVEQHRRGAPVAVPDNGATLWKPPASNDEIGLARGASRKRALSQDEQEIADENNNQDDKYHANEGAAAAAKFYDTLKREQGNRADSLLYHMRELNNWAKNEQIQELAPRTKSSKDNPGLRILDLACGKGGDLAKWAKHVRGVANYVGIDVARQSLVDAAERVRNMREEERFKSCTFCCADLGFDVPGRLRSPNHKQMQKLLTWSIRNDDESRPPEFKMIRGGGIKESDRFDVVSIQFAIHYMMETKKRARRFFRTVSQLLDVGGNLILTTTDARVIVGHLMNLGLNLHFDEESGASLDGRPEISVGGGACRISFEPETVKTIFQNQHRDGLSEDLFGLKYTFTLVEGSDHAAGVGDAVNVPEWLTPIPVLVDLAKEVGLELDYAQNFHEFFQTRSDPNEFPKSHSNLYKRKVLNRNGSISSEEWEISRLYLAMRFRKVREPDLTPLSDDEEVEENEEDDEMDPSVKAKLMPRAFLAAKKDAGDRWDSLSEEKKMGMIEGKLKQLAKSQK